MPFRTDEMITAKEVTAITGLSRRRVVQAAAAGYLTLYRPPAGVNGLVKYGRKSAVALAESMIRPATAVPARPTESPPDESATPAQPLAGARSQAEPAEAHAASPATGPTHADGGDDR